LQNDRIVPIGNKVVAPRQIGGVEGQPKSVLACLEIVRDDVGQMTSGQVGVDAGGIEDHYGKGKPYSRGQARQHFVDD